MTARPAVTPRKSSPPALLSPTQNPGCEVLFELFEGELGRVELGRILSGKDAGRLVTLRQLSGAPSAELTRAVAVARSISSPRLKKTLGTLRVDGTWFLASEYLSGVALSELTHLLAEHGERVDLAAAVCIALDVVSSTIAARDLLDAHAASSARCLHPESVWLADFGETFLGEVPQSSVLADETGAFSGLNALENAEAEDVRSAGHLLLELATGSLGAAALEDPSLPTAVRMLIARAIRRPSTKPFESLHAFAEALGSLDSSLIATDQEVAGELERLMGAQLETRRQKIAMTERNALGEIGEQDETKFFRAPSAPTQHETARPPANNRDSHSNTHRIAQRSEPDQPTTVFRRPNDLIDAVDEMLEAVPPPPSSPRAPSPSARAPLPPIPFVPFAPLSVPAPTRARFITPRRALILFVLLLAALAFAATTHRVQAQFPALFH